MKSPIFRKSFEEIFTPERIRFEAKEDIKSEDLFDFAPHKNLLIPKNGNEYRTISIPDKKLKVIQKILADELSYFFKFSDRSYAYQKNRSPIRAINRVKNILNNYEYVLKCDIDSFFDTIDHDRLIKKLQKYIKDSKIIYLIWLFLKNGALFKNSWVDKLEGIYQGDVLSPLLSNIYLHSFDITLQKRGIEFIRYADDLIFFAKTYKEAQEILDFVNQRLALEGLRLDEKKSYIIHKSKSFEYLGVRFYPDKHYSIDNERFMQKLSKISKATKKLIFLEAVKKIKEFIVGFKNYYLYVINDEHQLQVLQNHIDEILIRKIVEAKNLKIVTKKQVFLNHLSNIEPIIPSKNYAFDMVKRAYEILKLQNPKKAALSLIESKKRAFLKNQLKQTELIVTQAGTSLGFRQGEIVVKHQGKVQKRFAIHKIKRVIITNIKTSISTYLLFMCAKEKIDIDFIYENEPFALLTYYKAISKELHLKQLKLTLSPIGLRYAKSLHYAKAKNQINLIKYFNRRRESDELKELIENMEGFIPKLKSAKDSQHLLGVEAQISKNYWRGFKIIASLSNFQRFHQNAPDSINQALNYGYAILYNRIQSALIKEGLNIYYSFLHTTDYKKPTLVFDMIEPFRQPVVDREILSILTKRQKLTSKGGRLSEKSKKLIIQNIQERLSSQTKTRYGKTTYLQLISFEARELKHSIEKLNAKHRFFIAKY